MTPSLLACKNWLLAKMAQGETLLGPLPTEWMQKSGMKPTDAVDMFIAAQKQLELVAEVDGNGHWRLRKRTDEKWPCA